MYHSGQALQVHFKLILYKAELIVCFCCKPLFSEGKQQSGILFHVSGSFQPLQVFFKPSFRLHNGSC